MKSIIMHIDGDGFFAYCEVALRPDLRGKPVVTGEERGIVSAMTYEAKALGITRGLSIYRVRRGYPEVTVLPSNYELYKVFSARMRTIVRRHVADVEAYSIDECFADMSSLGSFRAAEKIARRVKHELRRDLGLTFSVGVTPTKVLAKVASKWQKPDGFTVISPEAICQFLVSLPVGKVWGIGAATAVRLKKLGITFASELQAKERFWVEEHFDKPLVQIWFELKGVSIFPVDVSSRSVDQKSISRTRTFTPASGDSALVFSELSKNIEEACAEARHLGLRAASCSFFVKTKNFEYRNFHCACGPPTSSSFAIIKYARAGFGKIWYSGEVYRSSGVTLSGLVPEAAKAVDLFGESERTKDASEIFMWADTLGQKFGRRVVSVASSLSALRKRGSERWLKRALHPVPFVRESIVSERYLPFPLLGEVL